MIKFIDMTGKTEDEAIRRALEQLGLERDDVSVEILERAKSGFLGIGGSPATVRVSYDDGQPEPKPEPVKPEPKSAAPKAEKKPVIDWLSAQGRFKHLLQEKWEPVVEAYQAEVDKRWEKLIKLSKL